MTFQWPEALSRSPTTILGHRLLEALGRPCEECSLTILAVLNNPHDRHAFDRAVAVIGRPTRQALSRTMRKHGFPSPGELQDRLRTLAILAAWEAEGHGLQAQAYAAGVEPTTLHRAVVRATGMTWRQVRDEGVEGFLVRVAGTVGRGIRCGGAAD